MANLMAFGTRKRLAMIPCPLSTLGRTVNRQRNDYAMSNGATLVRTGRMSSQAFDFTWLDTLNNLTPVIEMGKENGGPPYYFLDPGILANGWNALPAFWSAPGWYMGADNALAADFAGQFALLNRNDGTLADGTVATPAGYVSSLGCPEIGVTLNYPIAGPYPVKDQCSGGVLPYLLDSGVLKASHVAATVIVPPNYKFAMRITADVVSGTPGVCYTRRTSTATGRFTSIWGTTVTRLVPGGITTPATFTNSSTQWSTVDIFFGGSASAGAGGVLALYALEAYVLPSAGSLPAAFSQGVGATPLFPSDDGQQITVYGIGAADSRKQHGISWSLMEGDIAW